MKFENKIVFIKDKYFQGKRNVAPYWFIFNIENKDGEYIITAINLYGEKIKHSRSKAWIYSKIELINVDYIRKEFIKNIFKNDGKY